MSTLYLCGGGNPEGVRLSIIVNRHEQRWERIVLLDDDETTHGTSVLDVPVVGTFAELANADGSKDAAVNLVARKTQTRQKVRERIVGYGVPLAKIVHPSVDTFGTQLPDEDVMVYQNATISALSSIDVGSVVFGQAVVGHRGVVGKCCVLAPGAVMNARVKLGDRVYMGTNCSVLPDITLGDDSVIGAVSSVIGDVPAGATAVGVPAEIIEAMPAGAPATAAAAAPAAELAPGAEADLRKAITEVWRGLLKKESVGLKENFFEAGGTSLLAMQMCKEVRDRTGLNVPVTDAFRFPTIAALTSHLAGARGATAPAAPAGPSAQDKAVARRRAMRQRV